MLASALSHHQVWALHQLYVIIIFLMICSFIPQTHLSCKKKSMCYVISQGQMKK